MSQYCCSVRNDDLALNQRISVLSIGYLLLYNTNQCPSTVVQFGVIIRLQLDYWTFEASKIMC
jgi:hypothetical protein